MSDRTKKIFLVLTIIVPFLLYCVYYYGKMVKNAPYKFAEFESVVLKAGLGDNYQKLYDSKSQEYQYITLSDSVIHKKVKMSKDELLYLHRKAAELGFWDWPSDMLADTTGTAPRYYLEYKYQRKNKVIELDAAYHANPKLKDAALQLIKIVDQMIADASERR